MSMTLSGDGTITGLAAGGLPDATIQQADLATNVAGTGPAFSAYQSSAQTITSSTITKIQFQTKEFDTANCFDNTTNYRFTPNVAGYYQVTGGFQVAATPTVMNLFLYKNGTLAKILGSTSSSIVSGFYGTALIYLNGSTDYIELYLSLNAGQATSPGIDRIYFQAVLVRAA